MLRIPIATFAVVLAVTGLADERQTSRAVAFMSNGIRCRMTWTGPRTGWRLQTADARQQFSSEGAVQKLAAFLGEGAPSDECSFERIKDGDAVVLKAEDGSTVRVSRDGSFVVFSSSRKAVTEVGGVRAEDGKICLFGNLLDEEPVFGLGERFDQLNKRGQRIELWACDGYNNSNATYLPIPFFVTHRGCGVFVNLYERQVADFGRAEKNVWRLEIDKPTADVYFFAKDKIPDAISAYVALSGRPDVPEDWNAGPLICRYGPDLTEFKGPTYLKSSEGLIRGQGVKDIVEGHLKTGVRPTGVILEAGRFYGLADAERIDTLTNVVRYLTDRGIVPMIYMAMGKPPIGEKRFVVGASIETNGVVWKADARQIPWVLGVNKNPDAGNGRFNTDPMMDITDPDMWDWYLNVFWRRLVELGVRGVKIDFCEELPDDGVSYGGMVIRYKWRHPEVFAGTAVHHAYPTFFISRLYKALSEMCRDKGGFMVVSRGGGIGSQRNPFLWAGDQVRSFEKLDDQLLAVLNSGMSGVPFMTYDMAGYHNTSRILVPVGEKDGVPVHVRRSADTPLPKEEAIFARGLEFTAFTPCIQTHGDVRNVYEFSESAQAHYRKYVRIRDRLAPYFSRLERMSAEKGIPVVRPLVYRYPEDRRTWDLNDEFLVGDALLVAPVLDESGSREVYLPKGSWKKVPGLEVSVHVDMSHSDGPWLMKLLTEK